MSRTVLISRSQLHGYVNRMIRATVLEDKGATLRVVVDGQSKVIEVKAAEVRDAPKVFGNQAAVSRGAIVQNAIPDSPGCLVRILGKRGSNPASGR